MTEQGEPAAGSEGGEEVDEQELRERLEEEIRNVRIEDLVVQSAASLLNLAARRIAKADERDLAQAKTGIDAASALAGFAPQEARSQLERAVSELQVLYAKEADGGQDAAAGDEHAAAPAAESKPDEEGKSGLWTPGG